MELDDLKHIWKSRPFPPKMEEEIASMLKGKSRSAIARLRRNIWLELIFTAMAGGILLYYAITVHDGALRWSFIAFLILFVGYSIYYVKKMNLLSRFEGSEGNIKTNLKNLIADLEAYIRFYKKSYSLLYPVYFVLILLFVGLDRGMDELLEALREPRMILYLVFLTGVFITSVLWFTTWYLKKLYGNHLEKLKDLLADIEGEMGTGDSE